MMREQPLPQRLFSSARRGGGAQSRPSPAALVAAATALLFLSALWWPSVGGRSRRADRSVDGGGGHVVATWPAHATDTLVVYVYRPAADAEAVNNFNFFILAGVLEHDYRCDYMFLLNEADRVGAGSGGSYLHLQASAAD